MTQAELHAAGFRVPAAVHERLSRFVEALLRENASINLTAIRAPADVWSLHVCDSLALAPLIDEHRPRTLLDLGSGGGIPGIPLACIDDALHVTLLDATRKKVAAATRIASAVGLPNVRGVWGRAEELGGRGELRERFDAVVARAVAKLPKLLEYSAGLVRSGGACWFPKSLGAIGAEIPAAEKVARRLGFSAASVRTYDLPAPHGQRVVVIYQKL